MTLDCTVRLGQVVLDLNKTVAALGPDLARCLQELMDNNIRFQTGDWGKCPMGYLAYAKRRPGLDCDVDGLKAISPQDQVFRLIAQELQVPDAPLTTTDESYREWRDLQKKQEAIIEDPRTEFARLLGVESKALNDFASAWDTIPEALRQSMAEILRIRFKKPQPSDFAEASTNPGFEEDKVVNWGKYHQAESEWNQRMYIRELDTMDIAHELLGQACQEVAYNS